MPLYRMEQEFKRNDVNLNRQNMANWTIQCADCYLAILYDHLHTLLYGYHVLQADETPVEVTKDGRPARAKSYIWIYRTGKSYGKAIVLYEYQKDRKADHPQEFLKGFQGVCVTDGCQAYHSLAENFRYFIFLKTTNFTYLPVPHKCSAQQQEVHHIVPLSSQEHHESALPLNE